MNASHKGDEETLESLLGRVADEFTACAQRGERPDVEAFARRYPALATVLRQVLPALQVLAPESLPTQVRASQGPDDDVRAPPGYEVLGLLGRGGMGVVYKARHLTLDRVVALKMIRTGQADGDTLARFRAEALAAARLQHSHVVQVYEVGEVAGRPYLALEYVAGGSLDALLKGEPRPPQEAARLVETLARAVAVAHAAGLVHRDLKPANVLLTPDGTPKIADFGLVKRLDEDSGQTGTGVILGTPSYMAPEQTTAGKQPVGPAADIYALGAVLYELLTGRPPFRGTTVLDTLQQVREGEPVPPSRLQPGVPRDLETICLKCLQKEPPRRYLSAEALADDLRRFRAGEPVMARPLGRLGRGWRWCRRNPGVAALLALAATLLVGGFAAVASQWWRAEQNRRIAEARRDWAEGNFLLAQEAVDELLTQAAEGMADVPQMDALRRQLLTKALALHEKFLARQGDDEAVRREAGRALRRMSEIHVLLGDLGAAGRALDRAEAILAEASGPDPHADRARLQILRGKLSYLSGNYADAAVIYADALARLDEGLAKYPEDTAARYQAAVCGHHRGNTLLQLGQVDAAAEAFRGALAHLDALPLGDARHRQQRASTLNSLGQACRLTSGRAAEAERAFRDSRRLVEELLAEGPGHRTYRRFLSGLDANLAGLLHEAFPERAVEAMALLHRARDVNRRLVDDFPDVPEYREALGSSLFNLGLAWQEAHQCGPAVGLGPQAVALVSVAPGGPLAALPLALLKAPEPRREALDALTAAVEVQSRLVREFGAVPAYRYALARSQAERGHVLNDLRRYPEAADALDRAEELYVRLTTEHPKNAEYRSGRAICVSNQAARLRMSGKVAESLAVSRQALAHHKAARSLSPRNEHYKRFHMLEYALLAETLVRFDHAGAAAAADEMALEFAAEGPAHRVAGQYLARCVPVAEKDARLPEARRRELQEEYSRRAVQYLRRWADHNRDKAAAVRAFLLKDPSLAPVRSRPEFQALVAERGGP